VAITSPDYVVFSINHSISPKLLLIFLKSIYGIAEINNNTQGAVRSRLYYRNLAKINFPFSGIDRHKEAESLLNGFEKINQKKAFFLNLLNRLTQSILAKAFRGELVSQDENDEPASTLLERIKKTKIAEVNKSKKKKILLMV
jgi:type I restriction enzyme S subunit